MVASVLDTISVESPCSVPWNSMRGDGRSRFCSQCRLNVFNISEMSRPDAEELIRSKNGRLCVRYYRRADGTVATGDCGSRWRRKFAIATGLFFAALAATFGWLIWNAKEEDRYNNWARRTEPFATALEWIDPVPRSQCVMGIIAP